MILPENFSKVFTEWLDVSPRKVEIPNENHSLYNLYFFIEFSIPWIWKWEPIIGHTEEEIP